MVPLGLLGRWLYVRFRRVGLAYHITRFVVLSRRVSAVLGPEELFSLGSVAELLILSSIVSKQHGFGFNALAVSEEEERVVALQGLDVGCDESVVRATMYFVATWFGIRGRSGVKAFQVLKRSVGVRVAEEGGAVMVYYAL